MTTSTEAATVAVPVEVLERALAKMKREYDRVGREMGETDHDPDENWAEIEALAEYLPEATPAWLRELVTKVVPA